MSSIKQDMRLMWGFICQVSTLWLVLNMFTLFVPLIFLGGSSERWGVPLAILSVLPAFTYIDLRKW